VNPVAFQRRRARLCAGPGVSLPPTVSATLMLWVSSDVDVYQDTGFTTPASANNDPVKDWKDRSGNARHLLETTNAPTLQLNQIGGRASVRFDGTNDLLQAAFTLSKPFTLFVVLNQISWTGNDCLVCGAVGDNLSILQHGSSPQVKTWLGSSIGAAVSPAIGTWGHVALVNPAGGGPFLRLNAGSTAAQGGDSGAKGGITLGAHPGPNSFANAEFSEFLLYDADLGTTDETSVRNWLNSRHQNAIF